MKEGRRIKGGEKREPKEGKDWKGRGRKGKEVFDGITSVQLVCRVYLLSMRSVIAIGFTAHGHIKGLTHLVLLAMKGMCQ